MKNLVSVDVSVTDDRISLTFSHRAVATAYASYLNSEDNRPEHAQPIPGYRRHAKLLVREKQVTLALPSFITWFITCRLPDDEDSVTFTFMDSHDEYAALWAESMILFERVPDSAEGSGYDGGRNNDDDGGAVKQLHVRRLWNRVRLVEKLDSLRRAGTNSRVERNSAVLKSLAPPMRSEMQQDPDMWW
ncbi:hypothetical protein QBC37DRAFT_29291 [Rhypophila decipiens]|uniref:Uncharacterized protein n=1 Tax=Rhypophila decipiens TaxID=261697 RepID=A0AAN7B549_9PEZI|nr:hypothetical protein QBC37DRAFT_29291 [Rhypophila decipiens]